MQLIELNLKEKAISPALTGWIGLALSNSTFWWYNDDTASEILKCFPGPNIAEKHCAFYECMNQISGIIPLTCIDRACKCQNLNAEFFACVEGNTLFFQSRLAFFKMRAYNILPVSRPSARTPILDFNYCDH